MSLFKRVIGVSGDKIAVHKIQASLSEVSNGRLSVGQVRDMLGLNGEEVDDLNRFLSELATCADKLATSSRVFNYLYLGEVGEKTYHDYTDESLFWKMLEAE